MSNYSQEYSLSVPDIYSFESDNKVGGTTYVKKLISINNL